MPSHVALTLASPTHSRSVPSRSPTSRDEQSPRRPAGSWSSPDGEKQPNEMLFRTDLDSVCRIVSESAVSHPHIRFISPTPRSLVLILGLIGFMPLRQPNGQPLRYYASSSRSITTNRPTKGAPKPSPPTHAALPSSAPPSACSIDSGDPVTHRWSVPEPLFWSPPPPNGGESGQVDGQGQGQGQVRRLTAEGGGERDVDEGRK
jgi:hypothetical protein